MPAAKQPTWRRSMLCVQSFLHRRASLNHAFMSSVINPSKVVVDNRVVSMCSVRLSPVYPVTKTLMRTTPTRATRTQQGQRHHRRCTSTRATRNSAGTRSRNGADRSTISFCFALRMQTRQRTPCDQVKQAMDLALSHTNSRYIPCGRCPVFRRDDTSNGPSPSAHAGGQRRRIATCRTRTADVPPVLARDHPVAWCRDAR